LREDEGARWRPRCFLAGCWRRRAYRGRLGWRRRSRSSFGRPTRCRAARRWNRAPRPLHPRHDEQRLPLALQYAPLGQRSEIRWTPTSSWNPPQPTIPTESPVIAVYDEG